MSRPHKGGWTWEPAEHLQALAACLRWRMTAEHAAKQLNEQFNDRFPGMALTKNSIVSALRNKGVPERLRAMYPEDANDWIAEFKRHKPGRGKKGRSGPKPGKKKSEGTTAPAPKKAGRPVTAADFLAYRKNKGPGS